MGLTAAEHQQVKRLTMAQRNANARANRVRVAEVSIWTATNRAGQTLTLALSAKEPSRAYVLRVDPRTGATVCDCFISRWRGVCPHVEALAAHEASGG